MDLKVQSVKVGPERTNCYVVSTRGGEAFVVDPGGEAEKILELAAGISDLQLKYILLTHGHFDHVGAVDQLRKTYPEVPIYMAEEDMVLYRELPEQGVLVGQFVKPQHAELEAVVDGQFLPFGDTEIQVIATPGHTPGGVCYKIEHNIFTGDTLFWHAIGRTDLPLSSEVAMKISLDKLSHLDPGLTVLPGHGRQTTIGEEVESNPYI